VGEFSNPDGEYLDKGQSFRLDLDDAKGDKTRVKLPHPEIIAASEVGHALLVDDGKVKLIVTATGPDFLECVVRLSSRVFENLPATG
jgi:pyruvate kinase